LINETLEIAGIVASAAALEQSYIWTMSSAPYASLAAGKGLATTGVLNIGGVGIGSGLANIGRRFGLGESSNVYKFLAGGNLFGESLGFHQRDLIKGNYEELANKFFDPVKHGWEPHLHAQRKAGNVLRARHLKFAGRLAGGLAIANLVGTLASPLIYSAGRGLQAINDIARQPMAAFNSADWGNQLGSAFMTSQAVTERQRAQQILQQTGIVGHGSMGKEANMMHG
jgi:hypothetical protein